MFVRFFLIYNEDFCWQYLTNHWVWQYPHKLSLSVIKKVTSFYIVYLFIIDISIFENAMRILSSFTKSTCHITLFICINMYIINICMNANTNTLPPPVYYHTILQANIIDIRLLLKCFCFLTAIIKKNLLNSCLLYTSFNWMDIGINADRIRRLKICYS